MLYENYVLAVGLRNKSEMLESIPLRVVMCDKGMEALKCLKKKPADMLISRWQLCDMPDGELFRRFSIAKPHIPTIAFIGPGSTEKEEIEARSFGVSMVLTEDCEFDTFHDVVCQLLKLTSVRQLQIF
jgi:DNA-binding NtrC family response regulator